MIGGKQIGSAIITGILIKKWIYHFSLGWTYYDTEFSTNAITWLWIANLEDWVWIDRDKVWTRVHMFIQGL